MSPPDSAPKPRRTRAITSFGVAMLGVLAFALLFVQNFKTVIVAGDSMLPTFKSGRRLLATKAYWLVGPIRQNDIVVVSEKDGTGYFIKRVYRLTGETVDTVNQPRNWRLASGPFVVPKNTIYVLGDNREVSSDSREFGPVELSRVLGKVVRYP